MRSGAPFGPEWVISRGRHDVRAESGQPSTTDLEAYRRCGPDRRRSTQFDVRPQKGAAFTRSQAPMTAQGHQQRFNNARAWSGQPHTADLSKDSPTIPLSAKALNRSAIVG